MRAAPLGQSYKYLADSTRVPSAEAWSEVLSLCSAPRGQPLVTTKPAVIVKAVIYTQEDLEPSDLL